MRILAVYVIFVGLLFISQVCDGIFCSKLTFVNDYKIPLFKNSHNTTIRGLQSTFLNMNLDEHNKENKASEADDDTVSLDNSMGCSSQARRSANRKIKDRSDTVKKSNKKRKKEKEEQSKRKDQQENERSTTTEKQDKNLLQDQKEEVPKQEVRIVQRSNNPYSSTTHRTTVTLKQQTVFGKVKEQFDSVTRCPVCRAKHNNQPKPHKSHHPSCQHNRKTKGMPQTQKQMEQDVDEAKLKARLAPLPLTDKQKEQMVEDQRLHNVNTKPLEEHEKMRAITKSSDLKKFFERRPTTKLSNKQSKEDAATSSPKMTNEETTNVQHGVIDDGFGAASTCSGNNSNTSNFGKMIKDPLGPTTLDGKNGANSDPISTTSNSNPHCVVMNEASNNVQNGLFGIGTSTTSSRTSIIDENNWSSTNTINETTNINKNSDNCCDNNVTDTTSTMNKTSFLLDHDVNDIIMETYENENCYLPTSMMSKEEDDILILGSKYEHRYKNDKFEDGADLVVLGEQSGLLDSHNLQKILLASNTDGTSSSVVDSMKTISKYIRKHYFPLRLDPSSNSIPENENTLKVMNRYQQLFPPGKLYFEIPQASKMDEPNPLYHAIEDFRLYFVFWEINFPNIYLPCTKEICNGELIHQRSDMSKGQQLFPIFESGRPTSWCVVQNYKCNVCKKQVKSNNGELLHRLPPHIAQSYPVNPCYANNQQSHLSRHTTNELDDVMVTNGSATAFSRSLYWRLNQEYVRRVESYFSQCKFLKTKNTKPYVKHSEWICTYVPNAEKLREVYELAQRSNLTSSGVSEYDRYTREIQGVGSKVAFAQDHTVEVTKNYLKSCGASAKACWTCCSETGEVASAVLVLDTKASQYAHAAEQVARRINFRPKVMYADTWPNLEAFWKMILGPNVTGRLGLFHFMNRIIRTLRETHPDYQVSIWKLRQCFWNFDTVDYEKVVLALTTGTLGRTNYKYSLEEIQAMQINGLWKQRYEKWMRKKLLSPELMVENLDAWWIRFKVTNSEGEAPGRGRLSLDDKTLFTADTRKAVINAKKSCAYIGDLLDLEDMYTILPPSPHTKHGLQEFVCHRAESKLESFHGPLSNFGNTGMKWSLADVLHLAGTARYNCVIRQKIAYTFFTDKQKKEIPTCFAQVPPFLNHHALANINKVAIECGVKEVPFKNLTALPNDNGERFFSEYFAQQKERNFAADSSMNVMSSNDRCKCSNCAWNPLAIWHEYITEKTVYHHHEQKTMSVVEARKTAPVPCPTIRTGEAGTVAAGTFQLPASINNPHYNSFVPLHQQPAMKMIQRNPYSTAGAWIPPPYYPTLSCTPVGYIPQHMGYSMQQFPPRRQTEDCCGKRAAYRWNNRTGRPAHDKDCWTKRQKIDIDKNDKSME